MSSIFDFVSKLDINMIERLYGKDREGNDGSFAAKAVFQMLSKLGMNYVMRLIFLTSPVDPVALEGWVYSECRDVHYATIQELIDFRILQQYTIINPVDNSSMTHLVMNEYFQKGMQFAITSPIEPWSDKDAKNKSTMVEDEINLIDIIEKNFMFQWSKVLLTLLNKPILEENDVIENEDIIKKEIISNFLLESNLMGVNVDDYYDITANGYRFLLMSPQEQMWTFILQFLKRIKIKQDEVLSLLFMLSECIIGHGYPMNVLTELQKQIIIEFYHFGLVHLSSKESDCRFYPCGILINFIIYDQKILVTDDIKVQRRSVLTTGTMKSYLKLQIIVQTNYSLIAYTNNAFKLHINILNIFVKITGIFQGMIMGQLSKEKIMKAYRRGITVSQILGFLIYYAHPVTANREHIVPLNIQDKLNIWYAEPYRIKDQDAVIVCCEFILKIGMNENDYNTLHIHAKDTLNCVIWDDSVNLAFAVTPFGFEQLNDWAQDKLSKPIPT